MTEEQINHYYKLAIIKSNIGKGIRLGQAFFNELPDEYSCQIAGTDKDPFYKDENFEKCFEFLKTLD